MASGDRREEVAMLLRVLSDNGQQQVLEHACRIYMREQRMTEDDVRELWERNLRPITVSLEANLAKARSDDSFRRFLKRAAGGR